MNTETRNKINVTRSEEHRIQIDAVVPKIIAAGLRVSSKVRAYAPAQWRQLTSRSIGRTFLAALGVLALAAPSAHSQRYQIPNVNQAIYLGWAGQIDTSLAMSQFFNADHTIAAWFLPQYPFAYKGPIFANRPAADFLTPFSGPEYMTGQGDASEALGAHPMLFVQFGDRIAKYHVPQFQRNVWQHIAVVRQQNTLQLYLNGLRLTPAKFDSCTNQGAFLKHLKNMQQEGIAGIDLASAIQTQEAVLDQCVAANPDQEVTINPNGNKPGGVLQIGRRQLQTAPELNSLQAYGIVDDVAVFNTALHPLAIIGLIGNHRLQGNEPGLLAAWCFDKPTANEPPQPPILDSAKTLSTRAFEVSVSANRDGSQDSNQFHNPAIVGVTAVALRPPIPVGELWKVIQGYDEVLGSHWGKSSFSYDLIKPPQSDKYPNGSIYAPVRTGSPGKVVEWRPIGMSESGQEATWVTVKQAPGEFIRYRHLDFVFPFGGTCDPNTAVCTVPENQAPVQPAGTQVGSVGDAAKHLHAGARNRLDVEGVTFPIAFTDYWVWEPQQFPVPTHVTRGVPKTGQYILRTH